MNKKWTVGSLIPGQETSVIRLNEKHEEAVEPAPVKPAQPAALKIRQGSVTCSVPKASGSTLLDAALAQGCAIQYKCRKGTCGQCEVELLEGKELLSARTEAEQKKLGSSERRLACQSIIN